MARHEPSLMFGLMGALADLSREDFEKFKFFLMDRTLLRDFEAIKRRKLETESRSDILKVMLETHGIFTIDVVKRVLRELGYNQILHELPAYNPNAVIAQCQTELQSRLKSQFQFLLESENTNNRSFEELFITEADTGLVQEEHEVQQMEIFYWRSVQERTFLCQDIFRGSTETGDLIRAVLTKGVAGVGKTVLTQKFSLDWAEGKAHQDVQLLFPFTFRDLNGLRGQYSLDYLLHSFFSETKALFSFQYIQLLFIFDDLDECRLHLDFSRTRVLTDPTESASVEELLVNLIRGDLLPSARIWIITRPAAANQIPEECVSMVTEVRGFTNEQKEQYFRKKFRDEQQATAVISHIKSIPSLYAMSSIPIFCWIISDILLHLMETREVGQLCHTLIEMYIQFLVVQVKVKNKKYDDQRGADHWTLETTEMVRSLGKLAFEQLQKGHLIFYESDLSECGLDAAEVACYSGFFTEVFREERGLYQDKVYCFIHLSVQEFMAALHVHQTFFSFGENLLSPPHSSDPETFYRSAVDQALQSPNGHLDLFLRFLLGLSLPTNQSLLPDQLTQTGSDQANEKTIIKYIHKRLNEEGVSAERSLNLLHCVNELTDHSLLEKIQKITKGHINNNTTMSPAEWSAVTFLLLSSDSDLEQSDLQDQPSEEGPLDLMPAIKPVTLPEPIPQRPANELLLEALMDLVQTDQDDELDQFVFYLKNDHEKLPKSKLKAVKRVKIVEILWEYAPDKAVAITLRILRKMNKNKLANELSRESGVEG